MFSKFLVPFKFRDALWLLFHDAEVYTDQWAVYITTLKRTSDIFQPYQGDGRFVGQEKELQFCGLLLVSHRDIHGVPPAPPFPVYQAE